MFSLLKESLKKRFFEASRSPEPSTILLSLVNDLRTLNWRNAFSYPEGVFKQMEELLATI